MSLDSILAVDGGCDDSGENSANAAGVSGSGWTSTALGIESGEGLIRTFSLFFSLARSFEVSGFPRSGLFNLVSSDPTTFFRGESLTLFGARIFLLEMALDLSRGAPLAMARSLVDLLMGFSGWAADLFFDLSSLATRVYLKSSGELGCVRLEVSGSSSSLTLSFLLAPVLSDPDASRMPCVDSDLPTNFGSEAPALSLRFLLCSKLIESAGSKSVFSSLSSFLTRSGRSILTGSSSTNCDTGGGPISGESVVSASASANRLTISWCLSYCKLTPR